MGRDGRGETYIYLKKSSPVLQFCAPVRVTIVCVK